MIDFVMSGGNFLNNSATAAGAWGTVGNGNSITSSAPSGRADTYAWLSTSPGAFPFSLTTPFLGGSYTGLIAGWAMQTETIVANTALISFKDLSNNAQCELRVNGTGLLFFAKNGTQIGSSFSSLAIAANTWIYLEFKALFATSNVATNGTCEVRVNGVVVLTSSSINNAQNANGGSIVTFAGATAPVTWGRDFYVVDTVNGANTTYLGDVSITETFDIAPGINSKWLQAVNVGPFVLSAVSNGGASLAIYTGTITGGGSNAFVNYAFNTNGFGNANNNQVAAVCASSNTTALILTVSAAITPETNTASAVATPPFALTNVSTSNVFTGFVPGGGSNAYAGYNFNVVGFTNAANNVVNATCTASTATSLTLPTTGLVAENHATPVANASFQNIIQIGINKSGTRPNGDAAYIYDSTANDVSDFTHQQLVLAGIILGIAQLDYVRKDDAGTKLFQQFVNSASNVSTSSNVSPGNTYQYWLKVWETDPNTNTQWSVAGFNAATFGVKLIA